MYVLVIFFLTPNLYSAVYDEVQTRLLYCSSTTITRGGSDRWWYSDY